jgi:2-oxoglutarate ferredoxin oxidoreductase subunit delta
VNERYCSGCGFCVQYCPQKVLAHFKEINAKGVYPATAMALDKCTVCRLCELYCGSFAIAVEEE